MKAKSPRGVLASSFNQQKPWFFIGHLVNETRGAA